ncbi:MAG: PAS domain S-box protein [Steroidobacteraceae bacterium]
MDYERRLPDTDCATTATVTTDVILHQLMFGVIDAVASLVAILDHEGIVKIVNPEWNGLATRHDGDAAACGVGTNYLSLCRRAAAAGAPAAAEVARAIDSLLAGGRQPFMIDYPCNTLTETQWFSVTLAPILVEGKSGVLVMHDDVTHQRQLQQVLEKASLVARKMLSGVMVFDELGQIEWVNDAFCDITGVAISGALGRLATDFLGDEMLRAAGRESIAKAIACYGIRSPIAISRPDGALVWVEMRVNPLTHHRDEAQQFVAILNDVTERELLQQAASTIARHERERLANDLHDGLGQELAGAAMLIGGIIASISDVATTVRDDLARVENILRDSIKTCRLVARDSSSIIRGHGSLVTALHDLGNHLQQRHRVAIELRAGDEPKVSELVADHLYQIVQEAITNALKHAQPHKIGVSLRTYQNCVVVCVTDDGIGIDLSAGTAGMGLQSMLHRAEIIGADLEIGRGRSSGTRVRCKYVYAKHDPPCGLFTPGGT